MATQGMTVTPTVVKLQDELAVSGGIPYLLRNESPNTVLFALLENEPAADYAYWSRLGEREAHPIQVTTGVGVWLRTAGGEAILTVTD